MDYSEELKILAGGYGWVSMYFKDGSVQTIHTTLNLDKLAERGVELRSSTFYDLDRMEYVPFRSDTDRLEIHRNKPEYELEVLNFASRFI